MHLSKPIKLAICISGCIPLIVFAAEPSTQPTAQTDSIVTGAAPAASDTGNPVNDGTADDTTPHRADGTSGRGRFLRGLLAPISDYDKSEAMKYLDKHSHTR